MEEFDVIVIGSGPAGYIAAIRSAQLGLKTACIEKEEVPGGTCLNSGCIPSKTLLHGTELYHQSNHLFNLNQSGIDFWYKIQDKKLKVIEDLRSGILGLFKKNKVEWIYGRAQFEDAQTVSTGTRKIKARFFIIATGSKEATLPFLIFDEKKILSSTGALSLSSIPKKLLVVGAGVIGVELGSVFQRLGSSVTCIEFMDRICPTFDMEISKGLESALKKQGIEFLLSTKVESASIQEQVHLTLSSKEVITGDAVLVAIGRVPVTQGLALDKIGIQISSRGFIQVDQNFRTNCSNILAIGDVIEGPMLAHKASQEGVAAAEICAGLSPEVEYIKIPNVIYTSPEVASVGFSEEDLKSRSIAYIVGKSNLKSNSRAKCMGEEGWMKVIVDAKNYRILGVHLLSAHASELIGQGVMMLGKDALEVGSLCFPHPTLSECLKEACLAACRRALHH